MQRALGLMWNDESEIRLFGPVMVDVSAFQNRLKPNVEAGGGNVLLWAEFKDQIQLWLYLCYWGHCPKMLFHRDVKSAFKICCKSKKMGCFSIELLTWAQRAEWLTPVVTSCPEAAWPQRGDVVGAWWVSVELSNANIWSSGGFSDWVSWSDLFSLFSTNICSTTESHREPADKFELQTVVFCLKQLEGSVSAFPQQWELLQHDDSWSWSVKGTQVDFIRGKDGKRHLISKKCSFMNLTEQQMTSWSCFFFKIEFKKGL